jgi:HD-GYP domain-containing protein (c-di-GMP phosphodiesterase class II)
MCIASRGPICFGAYRSFGHQRIAGHLHDLGKMVIPTSILEKPDCLTTEEYAVIKQHTYWTYEVLKSINGMDAIAEWAAWHHERLDGSGYPFHIDGDRISSGARIMAVADTFTAMTEDRPYRPGMDKSSAIGVLKRQSKRHALDAVVVRQVIQNYEDIRK